MLFETKYHHKTSVRETTVVILGTLLKKSDGKNINFLTLYETPKKNEN